MPYDTTGIVERIKCETAIAIEDKVIDKLHVNGEPGALRLASELEENRGNFVHFKPKSLINERERIFYSRYIDAAIAFDFSLTSSEENVASTEVDLARIVTNGMVSVPLTASDDRIRQSIQTFTIAETFRSLLDKSSECDRAANVPNFAYPISGSIGIYKVISNFIDLNEKKDLTPKTGTTSIYSDALTFTTTATGSIAPHLVLTPPTNAFHLTGAGLTNTATRKDTDMVSIGLALPTKDKPDTKKKAADAINDQREIVFKNSLIQFFTTR